MVDLLELMDEGIIASGTGTLLFCTCVPMFVFMWVQFIIHCSENTPNDLQTASFPLFLLFPSLPNFSHSSSCPHLSLLSLCLLVFPTSLPLLQMWQFVTKDHTFLTAPFSQRRLCLLQLQNVEIPNELHMSIHTWWVEWLKVCESFSIMMIEMSLQGWVLLTEGDVVLHSLSEKQVK